MRFSLFLIAAVADAAAVSRSCEAEVPGPDEDGRYTISAEGIKAQVCVNIGV
jgi:hypothetical protein